MFGPGTVPARRHVRHVPRIAGTRHERELRLAGYERIAGLDEVGRGSLAGPVVAAAVILPERHRIPVDDRALRQANVPQGQGIDDEMIRLLREARDRLLHRELGRLQDVDPIDHFDLDTANADRDRPSQDQLIEALATRSNEHLAIA